MRAQEHWAQLPGNLWATIFSQARTPLWFLTPYGYQSWLFRLRTACHAFNNIFEEHGDLNSVIRLSKDPSRHLLSLLQWLRQHQAQVKQLDVLYGSPWLDMMLVALQSPYTCLEEVHLNVVHQPAILLLSGFHSIRHCVLSSTTGMLDLQPLSALPQLADLTLHYGRCSGLDAVAHLTALSLQDATAYCAEDCCCVVSLVHLTLACASFMHFHRDNVAACSRLQSLSLCKAFIHTNDIDGEEIFSFEDEEARLPSGLSALTALSSLRLNVSDCKMNLDWVTVLSALQVFQLEAKQAVFPASWSAMTCLRVLRLDADGFDHQQPHEEPHVQFHFDWPALASLEILDLQYLSIRGMSLSSLVSLYNLRRVCFGHLKDGDVDTTIEAALLAFQLGRNRPEVEFSMPYEW